MGVPEIKDPVEKNLVEVAESLKEISEIRSGLRGEDNDGKFPDKHITYQELFDTFKAFGMNIETGAIRQGTTVENSGATANQLWVDSDDDFSIKRAQ